VGAIGAMVVMGTLAHHAHVCYVCNMDTKKISVPSRAVMRRVNRALDGKGEVVKKHRGGLYILVQGHSGALVDLEKLARKLGSIQPWEIISDDG
jgi:hypothetical protein